MDYTKLIVSTIGDVLSDIDEHGMKATPSMKRLAAYGLLVEAELDEREQKLPEDVHFTPDGGMSFEFIPEWAKEPKEPKEPKVKRKNGRVNCKQCGTRLTGLQRLFCSKSCNKRNWAKQNPDRVKAHYNNHYKKQRAKQTLKIVK